MQAAVKGERSLGNNVHISQAWPDGAWSRRGENKSGTAGWSTGWE